LPCQASGRQTVGPLHQHWRAEGHGGLLGSPAATARPDLGETTVALVMGRPCSALRLTGPHVLLRVSAAIQRGTRPRNSITRPRSMPHVHTEPPKEGLRHRVPSGRKLPSSHSRGESMPRCYRRQRRLVDYRRSIYRAAAIMPILQRYSASLAQALRSALSPLRNRSLWIAAIRSESRSTSGVVRRLY